jgi:diguanylate cyclase (GGDEF)-like protein
LPLLSTFLIAILDRAADWQIGVNIELSLFFAVPIYLAIRFAGVQSGLLTAAAACLLSMLPAESTAQDPPVSWLPYWTAGVHIAFFAVAAALAFEYSRLIVERVAATTDFLTGVANRRGFYEMLNREIERGRRHGTPMTVLYVDCDEFKSVNDTMGHPAGNKALARIGAILKENTRAVDTVARLGGDEFAVILVEMAAERSLEVVARLRRELQSAMTEGTWPITFSVGAVTFTTPPVGPEEAIRAADTLMYTAKRAAKDRVIHAIAGQPAQ